MSEKKEETANGNFYSRNKKAIIIGSSIVVACAIGIGGYYFTIKNKVESWSNKVFPGIVVEDIDLSGMTKEEAESELVEKYGQAILNKKLVVKADGEQVEINFKDLSPEYNIEERVTEALQVGKQESIFKQNTYINKGINTKLELDFKYNDKKLSDYEEKLKKKVNKSPKDASLKINSGNINVIDGTNGKKINEEEMSKLIKESIDGTIQEVVEIEVPVETIKPKITKEELSKVNGVLGSFTSDYSFNSTNDRAANVELSTKAINGTLLMPGDSFSFNEVVGPRTAARGYRNAPTFVGNKVEDGLGGGICQTSTAINRAVIRAGLKPTERANHSMKASYSEYGLDSAVAWGYLDYKFTNTYNSPIYIQGYTTSNRSIVFNIYGNTAEKGGKTYDLVATSAVVTKEANIKRVNDATLEKGKEVWETKPVHAYQSKSSIATYKDGKQVSVDHLATHNYVSVDGVLKVGTKEVPVAPPVVPPVETPPTTEEPAATE